MGQIFKKKDNKFLSHSMSKYAWSPMRQSPNFNTVPWRESVQGAWTCRSTYYPHQNEPREKFHVYFTSNTIVKIWRTNITSHLVGKRKILSPAGKQTQDFQTTSLNRLIYYELLCAYDRCGTELNWLHSLAASTLLLTNKSYINGATVAPTSEFCKVIIFVLGQGMTRYNWGEWNVFLVKL
jgi:hypothetical protein